MIKITLTDLLDALGNAMGNGTLGNTSRGGKIIGERESECWTHRNKLHCETALLGPLAEIIVATRKSLHAPGRSYWSPRDLYGPSSTSPSGDGLFSAFSSQKRTNEPHPLVGRPAGRGEGLGDKWMMEELTIFSIAESFAFLLRVSGGGRRPSEDGGVSVGMGSPAGRGRSWGLDVLGREVCVLVPVVADGICVWAEVGGGASGVEGGSDRGELGVGVGEGGDVLEAWGRSGSG